MIHKFSVSNHASGSPPAMRNLRRTLLAITTISALLLFAGCKREWMETYNWTEDVKLADGASIVISRKTVYRFVPQMLSHHPARFTVEDKATIPRSATGESDIEFHVPIAHPMNMLLLIDRFGPNDTWTAVIASSCSDYWRTNGRPFHGYFEFHYVNGNWSRTNNISQKLMGRDANMSYRYHRGHVSQRDKESEKKLHDTERIKKILSESKQTFCA
jgi:hypothetical protein